MTTTSKILVFLFGLLVLIPSCAGWDFRIGNYSTNGRNFTMPVRGAYMRNRAVPDEESTNCSTEFRPWNCPTR